MKEQASTISSTGLIYVIISDWDCGRSIWVRATKEEAIKLGIDLLYNEIANIDDEDVVEEMQNLLVDGDFFTAHAVWQNYQGEIDTTYFESIEIHKTVIGGSESVTLGGSD